MAHVADHLSVSALEQQYRSCTDVTAARHLQAIWLLAKGHPIAEVAATMVQPGQSVALGAGTTTWLLAQHLLQVSGLTITTNSVKIADVLGSTHHVVLTGGVRTPSDALVGPVADLVAALPRDDVAAVVRWGHLH